MQTFDTRLAHLSRVHHIHGWYYMLSYLQSRSTFSSPHLIFTFIDSETVGWFTCEKRQQFFPWVCASCKLHYMFLHGSCVKGFVATWQSDTEMLPHSCDHITRIQLKLKGLREGVSLQRHLVELTIAIVLPGHSHSLRCLNWWVWCLEISAQGRRKFCAFKLLQMWVHCLSVSWHWYMPLGSRQCCRMQ